MQPLQHQMMGYDRAITMFSPDGRLLQVEYAKKTVKQGSTAIGIVCSDGVILVTDKRIVKKAYGKIFSSSLPQPEIYYAERKKLYRKVEDFFFSWKSGKIKKDCIFIRIQPPFLISKLFKILLTSVYSIIAITSAALSTR